jgi:hypothetical protein
MSSNSNTFRISNEQLLLINILNTMYNDNLRQINNITDTLNNLYDTNNQIRNLLIQLLGSNHHSSGNQRRNGFNDRRNRENNSDRDRNPNRVYLNNRPYIIDSVTEYTIPRQFLRNYANQNHNNNNNNNNLDAFTQLFQNFLQPVEIYPTQSQIETATRRVRYCDISRPINTQCPISMDEFNDNDMVTVIRHCGHTFHTEHLMNWFRSNCRCPVCRYDIRDYNSNASTEFFNNSSQANQSTSSSTQATNTQTSPTLFDSSNNNVERNYITRMDSITSNGSNPNFTLFDNFFNDSNNLNITTDASGNRIDNILGGTAALMYLLNNINNRTRGSG